VIGLPTYQGYIQPCTLNEAFDTLSAFRSVVRHWPSRSVTGGLWHMRSIT
jgi:hypothetical protein